MRVMPELLYRVRALDAEAASQGRPRRETAWRSIPKDTAHDALTLADEMRSDEPDGRVWVEVAEVEWREMPADGMDPAPIDPAAESRLIAAELSQLGLTVIGAVDVALSGWAPGAVVAHSIVSPKLAALNDRYSFAPVGLSASVASRKGGS